MDFSLSADQRALQDSVRRALTDLENTPWAQLTALGVPAILVPEAYSGLGLSLLDAALVSEALGAASSPTPFLGSALAAIAIRDAGSAAQKAEYLPNLATGARQGAAALAEAISGARNGAGLADEASRLTGTALFAIDAAPAALIVAATPQGGLYLLDGAAPLVTLEPMPTIDTTRTLAAVTCHNAAASPLAGGNEITASAALSRLRDAAYVLLAADMLGASQTMLDRAVAYAKDRVQFGRAIGSFQAVKHLCAEMAAKLEPCRALVWYAAHAFDEGLDDAPLAASHAKSHLSEVSRFVARTATEVHGGMGFTDLLGLHYWFKRVGLDRQLLGGPEQVRRHAAQLQVKK